MKYENKIFFRVQVWLEQVEEFVRQVDSGQVAKNNETIFNPIMKMVEFRPPSFYVTLS